MCSWDGVGGEGRISCSNCQRDSDCTGIWEFMCKVLPPKGSLWPGCWQCESKLLRMLCGKLCRSSLLKHSYDTVWGFVSRFPVILSIENHCSIQQQKKIAQYLKEILGDKLDLSSVVTGDSRQLPSPQNLKGKILVKVICYLWHIENPTGGSAWYLLCVFGSEE